MTEKRKQTSERLTRVEWRRQRRQGQPDVEGSLRLDLDFETHLLESGENVVSFVPEKLLEGDAVLVASIEIKHLKSHALHGVRSATVQEGSGLVERSDDVFWTDDPADSPARKTKAFSETVDENNGRLVDIVNVFGCRVCSTEGTLMHVPGVKLVEQDGAAKLLGGLHKSLQFFTFDDHACRVTRIGHYHCTETTSFDLLTEIFSAELVPILLREDSRNGNETLESAEHGLVTGVLGQLVSAVDRANDGREACHAGTATRNNTDVCVIEFFAVVLSEGFIIVIGDRLTEGHGTSVGSVLMDALTKLGEIELKGTRNTTFDVADFGRALTHVGPLWISIVEAIASSTIGDIDDSSAPGMFDSRKVFASLLRVELSLEGGGIGCRDCRGPTAIVTRMSSEDAMCFGLLFVLNSVNDGFGCGVELLGWSIRRVVGFTVRSH